MDLHQVSVAFQPEEDRLLLRIRTRQAQLLELWLTRRLMLRLWPALDQTVAAMALQGLSTQATVVPEARQMMSQAMKDRSRASGDFKSPFDEAATTRPLGDRPLLVHAVDLAQPTPGVLSLALRDIAGRQVALRLEGDLLNNLHSLLESALAQAQWTTGSFGLAAPVESSGEGAPPPPRTLN